MHCCVPSAAQGVPLVNVIESIDGEERFVIAANTTAHKKDTKETDGKGVEI